MFKSIRTTLLWWYVVILVGTVGLYGTVVYYALRRNVLTQVNDRIREQAVAIALTWEDNADEKADAVAFELTELFPVFAGEGNDRPYFIGWKKDGTVGLVSRAGLEVPFPGQVCYRTRGMWREITVGGSDGRLVLVGEHTGTVRAELSGYLQLLLGSGAAVLALALLGGWFFSGRVLAPIHRISRAASEISGSNLARRIDVGKTESELGRLAGTLNSAFDRLQKTVEQQSRFTADASHELRTPVSIVLATAEQTLAKDREAPEYRESLEAVLRAARRMKSIVDGLLALTRADSGSVTLERDNVDLAEVVEETLALLEPLAGEHAVTLSSSGPRPLIIGDRERIREVFTNLVTNAIRYNHRGGTVAVVVQENGTHVEAKVIDTGIGIAEEHVPHLFERFYRVDAARTRAAGGSGLGLAITKWIVESHGGSITVSSREGEGSTFTVRLPRISEVRPPCDAVDSSTARSLTGTTDRPLTRVQQPIQHPS
ncbi:MAG: HAMP domain-containing protein [Planctomycetes bacterium]|nr:HAMP domain-containing protein [Planctomycetota bacterium]MBI3843521.1 HAMP domain-containing protein [Planctomycetota bacterium]